MAKGKKEEKTEEKKESGRGRKVFLPATKQHPDGEARVDFIRRRYYDDGLKRSEIAKELTELTGNKVPYQIVFAATKPEKEGEGEGDKGDKGNKKAKGKKEAA